MPAAIRHACFETVIGKAYAQDRAILAAGARPTYFIEINMRDQVDWGHVFVAPGLATNTNISRTLKVGRAALYYTQEELKAQSNRVFLTSDSMALAPHLDSIAQVDVCELTRGVTHGHEAANPVRSPGKSHSRMAGMLAMFERDGGKSLQGNEAYYSATPTPASLHNFVQQAVTPGLRNGVALKMLGRRTHTVFHFAAGLPGGELDRIRSPQELASAFPSGMNGVPAPSIVGSAGDAEAFRVILDKVDSRFLAQRQYAEVTSKGHSAMLNSTERLVFRSNSANALASLALGPEESAFWNADIPPQSGNSALTIGEQVAVLYKLVRSGVTRTAALEYVYSDLHGDRPEAMVRANARQIALPLARLVHKLKEDGLYDDTVIAVYTLDGSRPVEHGPSGDRGKNSVILAGGRIRGGYYGDIEMQMNGTSQAFVYHAPDPVSGLPGPGVSSVENAGRISSAAMWRTVMKAAGVPDAVATSFPATASAQPLSFMLRG